MLAIYHTSWKLFHTENFCIFIGVPACSLGKTNCKAFHKCFPLLFTVILFLSVFLHEINGPVDFLITAIYVRNRKVSLFIAWCRCCGLSLYTLHTRPGISWCVSVWQEAHQHFKHAPFRHRKLLILPKYSAVSISVVSAACEDILVAI